MGWKCAPQVMGLVRGEPKPSQKHRTNGLKICKEAGYERASKSATLDRSRSQDNLYEGYTSGETCWGDMVEQASMYRVQVKVKTKSGEEVVRERVLRSDAVIGYAIIYNPPAEITTGWTDEEYARFYDNSRECMEIIEPRIFRKDTIRMSARHLDEGVPRGENEYADEHLHDIGECIDQDGHYCGNLIDAKLMDRINRNYPALMRERGWDMEDLDVTDWEKAKKDVHYRTERSAKRRKNGRSVNRYLVDKLQEKVQVMEEAISVAEGLKSYVEQMKQYNDAYKKKIDDANKRISETQKEMERQRLADKAKRKAEDEERHAYLLRLIELAKWVRDKSGSDVDPLPEDADEQTVQDRILADFQRWEDAIEAQKTALSESQQQVIENEKRIAERAADLQRREKEYEEIITLGRRAKAELVSEGIMGDDTDYRAVRRRLPGF